MGPMQEGIERVLNDVTVGKYDVVVSDQAISPSMRYLHFQELIEIVRETGVQIHPAILVKSSNLPQDMKQEIIESMQQPEPMGDAGTAGAGGPSPGGPQGKAGVGPQPDMA